ncbi:MAG: amidohydrolase family protein, partial [Planctomycetota bacterium]
AGMSPADALVSATVNAADLCGLSDTIGTIEAGKQADIIGVPPSPLEDVTVLQEVRFVMRGGRVYKRGE